MAGVMLAVGWCALSVPPSVAPDALPATVAATEFSAERAGVWLRELTRTSREVGSNGHRRAREYLVEALRQLGLEVEVQRATALRRKGNTVRVANVANIVARLAGSDSSAAVVLMSHYDTVPGAPGATDAGNGVAAILETMRALLAGPPLRNDVIALITDAEEAGLLGAQAYVDQHPGARNSGVVLNAEGRGHTGPVMMFRSSQGNGRMIRTLAKAAPFPAAESLANDVFRHMPNDTDLTVFLEAGLAGMDFANAEGLSHYHTPLDNFETADPRSLQHHGSYMLSLARAFGGQDLTHFQAPDRIYFSAPWIGVVHYPTSWALALALLAVLLVAGTAAVHWRGGRLDWRALLLGVVQFIVALIVLPLLAIAMWELVGSRVPEVAWFEHGSPYGSGRYLLGIGLLIAAIHVASAAWLAGRTSPAAPAVAALCVWALLGLASAIWLPGASYLFLWPLLIATAALYASPRQPSRHAIGEAALLGFAAAPILVFMLPMIAGMEVSLTLRMIAVPSMLLVLTLGLLVLPLEFLGRRQPWALPGLLAGAGVAVLAAALLGAGFDAQRKKPNSMNYLADAGQGAAIWYTNDPEPDEWTRQYLGADARQSAAPAWMPETLAGRDASLWMQTAELLRDDAPQAELLEQAPADGGRRMRLRITTPTDAYVTLLRFPDSAQLQALRIDGLAVPPDSDGSGQALQILAYGVPAEGLELEFVHTGSPTLELYLRANVPGLPTPPGGAVIERPDHMMAEGPGADMTRLQRSVRF